MSMQTCGVVGDPPEQLQPDSIKHPLLQPSPDKLLPSSHLPTAGIMVSPSPQISVHVSGTPTGARVQLQPVSTAQSMLHPSPSISLPSSHSSKEARSLSPHVFRYSRLIKNL